MRSIEDSLQRLGLERIDIALIHDIDNFTHGPRNQPAVFNTALSGAAKALIRLRDEGVVQAIGVGVNEWEVAYEAIKRVDFDCLVISPPVHVAGAGLTRRVPSGLREAKGFGHPGGLL